MGGVFGKITVETPNYQVEQEYPNANPPFEVRKYGELVEAYTPMDSDATRTPFMRLAGYIGVLSKPKNHKRDSTGAEAISMTGPVVLRKTNEEPLLDGDATSIPMTAPVVLNSKDGKNEMSFILPSKYTMDTAPIPDDPLVKLRAVVPRRVVVHKFSGTTNIKEGSRIGHHLSVAASDHGMDAPAEDFELYQYNAPFTIPCFKTNEVAIPLRETQQAEPTNEMIGKA